MDFVEAFNAHDLDTLSACVAQDATAVVYGSPFPVEEGRASIRTTSLQYLLAEGLTARQVDHPDAAILLLDAQGCVDVAVQIETRGDLITSLTYYTLPHCPDVVSKIAEACGLRCADQ